MSEAEGSGEEYPGGREMAEQSRDRARELRARAEVAWADVRRRLYPATQLSFNTEELLGAVERVPTEAYLGGIAGSLFASALLYATGRRTAGMLVGSWGPLALAVALYAKALRARSGSKG